jgi:predicted ATPase
VQALVTTVSLAPARALLDDTIRSVEAEGDLCYVPELLRVKAGLLLSSPQARISEGESCLAQSLASSRRQGARAWELRTSIDLAKRLAAQGRLGRAHALLRPVFDQFVEGAVSVDLRTAKKLLATWE